MVQSLEFKITPTLCSDEKTDLFYSLILLLIACTGRKADRDQEINAAYKHLLTLLEQGDYFRPESSLQKYKDQISKGQNLYFRCYSVDVLKEKIYPDEKYFGNIGQDFISKFSEIILNFNSMYIDGRN